MSPVNVGELRTEVTPDASAAGPIREPGSTRPWDELDRARRALAELTELGARTRAGGLDG